MFDSQPAVYNPAQGILSPKLGMRGSNVNRMAVTDAAPSLSAPPSATAGSPAPGDSAASDQRSTASLLLKADGSVVETFTSPAASSSNLNLNSNQISTPTSSTYTTSKTRTSSITAPESATTPGSTITTITTTTTSTSNTAATNTVIETVHTVSVKTIHAKGTDPGSTIISMSETSSPASITLSGSSKSVGIETPFTVTTTHAL